MFFKSMFAKSVFAAAAIAAAVALGSATSAQADPHINFSFGVGVPFYGSGYDSGYGPDPYYQPHFRHHRHHYQDWNDYADLPPPPPPVAYGISCSTGRNILRQNGFRDVQAYDCQGPVYGYQAWKRGEMFRVAVNFRGQVVSVNPVY